MRAMQRVSLALGVALLLSAAAYAGDRPHEGKITNVDSVAKAIAVQGEKGDSWTLNLSETTKMKNKLTFEELQPGDSVHFDFIEKDGQKWVTELRRTHRAKS